MATKTISQKIINILLVALFLAAFVVFEKVPIAILYLLAVFSFRYAGRIDPEVIGFAWPVQGFGFIYAFKCSVFFYTLAAVALFVALNIAHQFGGYEPNVTSPTLSLYSSNQIYLTAVYSPMVEELVFRGLLIGVPSALFGWRWQWIVLSAVAFSAIHFVCGNPSIENQISGLLLGWVFYKTRSLLPAIVLHFLGNIICLYAALFEILHPGTINSILTSLILS